MDAFASKILMYKFDIVTFVLEHKLKQHKPINDN